MASFLFPQNNYRMLESDNLLLSLASNKHKKNDFQLFSFYNINSSSTFPILLNKNGEKAHAYLSSFFNNIKYIQVVA